MWKGAGETREGTEGRGEQWRDSGEREAVSNSAIGGQLTLRVIQTTCCLLLGRKNGIELKLTHASLNRTYTWA